MIHRSRQSFDVTGLLAPFPTEWGYCISRNQTEDWPLETEIVLNVKQTQLMSFLLFLIKL